MGSELIEMWAMLQDSNNLIFAIFLSVCVLLFVVELLGLLFGFANDWIDGLLPDALKLEIDGIDGSNSGLVTMSSWVYLGRLPFLIWLMIFFGGWGVVGFIFQAVYAEIFGGTLIQIAALIATFFINLFVARYTCMLLKPILPKDETYAISIDQLVGREAEIVLGVARTNFPTRAKTTDQYGTTHYVMVEPLKDEEFKQGDKVILFELVNNTFKVVEAHSQL